MTSTDATPTDDDDGIPIIEFPPEKFLSQRQVSKIVRREKNALERKLRREFRIELEVETQRAAHLAIEDFARGIREDFAAARNQKEDDHEQR